MQQSFKDMAQRMVTAETEFLAQLERAGDLTAEEARKVFAVYRKAKVLKNEYAVSRISVKHGAFWDRAVIRNALAAA